MTRVFQMQFWPNILKVDGKCESMTEIRSRYISSVTRHLRTQFSRFIFKFEKYKIINLFFLNLRQIKYPWNLIFCFNNK